MHISRRAWFHWHDAYSYHQNVLIERLPDIQTAAQHNERIHIPGRGGITVWGGDYVGHVKRFECAVFDAAFINGVSAWLQGAGRLIISDNPTQYVNATIQPQPLSFIRAGLRAYRFAAVFDCDPFQYNVDHVNDRLVFAGGTAYRFAGKGSADSLPVLTVYGHGDVSLSHGGRSMTIRGLNGSVRLDSANQTAHNGSGTPINDHVRGDYLILSPGENTLTTTGSVTRIEIEPTWRWL